MCGLMPSSKQYLYSITTSARASTDGGRSRSTTLAVLRLITSPYLVGACTGRSASRAPVFSNNSVPDRQHRQLEHQQDNHAQRDHPSGRHRPSGKDGTPLLLLRFASQHSDLREAIMVARGVGGACECRPILASLPQRRL
jgi:hypothetical protein